MKKEKSRFGLEKQARYIVLSNKFRIFAQTIHNNYAPMILRRVFLYALLSLSAAPVSGQETEGSNIVSRTLLLSDGSKKIEHRVYDNGLGDVLQEVQSFIGSSLPSIVVHHEYDSYRRRTRTWLPVTSSGSGYVMSGTVAYQAQSQYDDTKPFSRTEYDTFLPSLPKAEYKAGAQWQNNEKNVSLTYRESVMTGMYADSDADGYLYTLPVKKYLSTQSVDEDGNWTEQYTDLNGHLMISETSQGYTYYVYDAKGNVRYVIPPILSAYLVSHYGSSSGHITDDDAMMQKYAYIYRYDRQGHCIYKKLPGCDPIYYVYDRTGALILTQDGNQRQRGEWAYTIPDIFGRPCISGICRNTVSYDEEPLHSAFVHAEYDGTTTETGGYAVHNITLDQQVLYTAAYYDSYSFIGHHGVPSSLTASSVSGYTVDTSLGQGLQTGSATAVMGYGSVTGYTYAAMYYDSRYNVSQVRATNHFGGTETTCTSYTYTGKPEDVWIQHVASSTGTLVEQYAYAYDGADRVGSRTLYISNGVPTLSSTMTYEYDGLGRLSKVIRPISSGTDPDVTYEYDLHGWTKKITTSKFREELFYADGPGTPCWNGNVSVMRWKDGRRNKYRGYKFTYDEVNRLTQAAYGEGDDFATNVNQFSESAGYDAHGNITSLVRRGKVSTYSYGVMDNLTLTYDGNQLTGVTETANDYNATGTFEYKRASGSEYLYDSNGSLLADRSRGIAYISYDSNGNPSRIYFMNGYMTTYTYSATGQKLAVEHSVALPNVTWAFGVKPDLSQHTAIFAGHTDYLLGGTLVVQEGTTKKLLFDGGYAKAERTSPTSTTYGYTLSYYNKDHLGNNRTVVSQNGAIEQITHYYPFGGIIADLSSGQDVQPYKYNGKELDLMHGLNTYDYGARQYFSILGRWDRMDPLCEKYYSLSPYNYCGNNPVNAIDIEGKRGVRIINNQDQTVTIKAVYYVETGFRLGGTRSNPITLQQYSIDDIMKMQSNINGYLNGLGLTVKEGDYSGYKIMFDLSFKDGGDQISASQKADSENYEGYDIGNTIFRLNSEMHNLFKPMGNDDLKKVRGAVTQEKKDIAMNMEFDNTMNRVHEIFHTFGFSDDESGNGTQHGIMHYPPLDPDDDDISILMNIPYLPTIINK